MQVADQVVLMLCSIYNFTFEVEDSMVEPDPEVAPQVPTVSSTLTESVTRRSTSALAYTMGCALLLWCWKLKPSTIKTPVGYYIWACSNRFKAAFLLQPSCSLYFFRL